MKIAIQLFGHLRSFRNVFPYLSKNIIEHYDCDIFIHTWSEEEHSDPSWHKNDKNDKNYVRKTNKRELVELYKPKGISIEDNNSIHYSGFFNANNNITLRALKAMCYSQFSVNELRLEYEKESGEEYDLIIMLRPDVMPLVKLDLSKFDAEFQFHSNASIHFSSGSHDHLQGLKNIHTPLASDLFFIAKPNVMSTISSSYLDFDRFYVDFSRVNAGGISAPENSFLERLYQHSIVPRFYVFPYAVIRTKGDNHIKVAIDQVDSYERLLVLPTFLEESPKADGYVLKLCSKLSPNKLNKLLKQLNRIVRSINRWVDVIESLKGSTR